MVKPHLSSGEKLRARRNIPQTGFPSIKITHPFCDGTTYSRPLIKETPTGLGKVFLH